MFYCSDNLIIVWGKCQFRCFKKIETIKSIIEIGETACALAKNLSTGEIAIGLFNLSDEPARACFNLDELGLPYSTRKTLSMTDAWTGKQAPVRNANVTWKLDAHDCAVFRAKVVDL